MSSIEFGNRINVGGSVNINQTREARELPSVESGDDTSGKGFGDYMKNLMQEANQSQLVADKAMQEVAAGRSKDLHGAVLAMEKADIQFRMLTQVRNKVIEAYREILRMQV